MVLDWPHVEKTRMFGHPSYLVGGELFAVLSTAGVALTRLPPSSRAELEEEYDVGPFESGGKEGTEWAYVEIDGVEDLNQLLPYMQQSYQAARSDA